MKKIDNNKGFTLIEVLITLTITVILLSGVVELLTTSLRASRVCEAKIEAQQTARFAVDGMVRDLQFAKKITINSPTQLELETDKYGKINDQPNTQPTITYFLDTNKVLKREKNDNSGSQPITGASTIPVSITELNFKPLKGTVPGETDTVCISLTATANEKTIDEISYTVDTTVTRLK